MPKDPREEELLAAFRALGNAMRRKQYIIATRRMPRFERALRLMNAKLADKASDRLYEAGVLDAPSEEVEPL
tara:strand:- start:147 stop:362 length:216 start_codon:yes stop_codon:yes gene_type:complete